jgi:TrmH family RNA methyltransferase
MLDNVLIILHRPQKLVNIAGTVRAMKNMGLRRLRLVQPLEYATDVVGGIAHRSDDLLAATTIHASLDDALADAIYVVGTTARPRGSAAPSTTPRLLAPDLLARAAAGPVALLFGPEDNGLTNAELDRCHTVLSIPTDPAYRSLNLAQAVLLVAYEIWLASAQPPTPRRESYLPANAAQLEGLFDAIERALWGVEFFKTGHAEGIMRSLRSLIHRAQPDTREAALLKAIGVETISFLRRKGIVPGTPNSRTAEGAEPGKSGTAEGAEEQKSP